MTDPAQDRPSIDVPHPAAPPAATRPAARRTNPLAVISLVAGLCGFSLVPLLGSIVAVITGHLALAQIQRSGEEGSSLARAGLWLGYIAMALVVLAVAGVLLVVVIRSSTL